MSLRLEQRIDKDWNPGVIVLGAQDFEPPQIIAVCYVFITI
jgi:hypothetical protein